MKNKNGFTLVELLAVIVILGVLTAIAIPSVIGISNKIKQDMLYTKGKTIETAAELYAQDNKKNCNVNLTIQELIELKYLKSDVISDTDIDGSKKLSEINTSKDTTIDMSKICGGSSSAGNTYIASVNSKLKANNIMRNKLGTDYGLGIETAYNKCITSYSETLCKALSRSYFNGTDSDYEDYRVDADESGYAKIYRAFYKYTITVYQEDSAGNKTKIKEVTQKVDDDNAEDLLNNVSLPAGNTYESDCFGLYYDNEDFIINTSGTHSGEHDKNETCSLTFKPKGYTIVLSVPDNREHFSISEKYENGFYYINDMHVGDEFEFMIDNGYKATGFWCENGSGTLHTDSSIPYVTITSLSDQTGDCSLEIVKN